MDKQRAAPTFEKGYGYPVLAFVDHGPDGCGEPLAVLLRTGNAGSNTATDHIAVAGAVLRQLPGHQRGGHAQPGRQRAFQGLTGPTQCRGTARASRAGSTRRRGQSQGPPS